MDYTKIFELIQKGVSIIEAIDDAYGMAAPAIEAIKNLVSGAQQGAVTDEQLTQTEALLDQLIADFNVEVT